jgi:sorbitol-specific phosphotransferase system component IIA
LYDNVNTKIVDNNKEYLFLLFIIRDISLLYRSLEPLTGIYRGDKLTIASKFYTIKCKDRIELESGHISIYF